MDEGPGREPRAFAVVWGLQRPTHGTPAAVDEWGTTPATSVRGVSPRPASERAMRPFWIHQIAEYLIGLALVAQGVQDTEPLVPAVAGALVVLNAAVTRGPVSAFRWVGRRTHKWLDVGVIGVLIVGAVQPWLPISSGGRLVLAVMVLPLGFLWFYTDWAERPARAQRRAAQAGPTSDSVGRTAGRVAGAAYSTARESVRKRRRD